VIDNVQELHYFKFNNSEHNKIVCKNQKILTQLIDVACLLEDHALPLRGHDEHDSAFDRGNCIEFSHH
jgi:hypothetical protein